MHDTDDDTTRDVESTINAIPLAEPLFTRVKPGTKKGARQGWKEPENLLTADEAREWAENDGNVGVALGQSTGDGWKLVVFDVEEEGVLPPAVDKVIKEHVLSIWKSPHGGLNRLVAVTPDAYALLDAADTEIDPDGDGNHELELLTNSHALIPPSIIEHRECRDSKEGCPSKGRDPYRLVDTHPDANRLTEDSARDLLDRLGLDPDRAQNTTTSDSDDYELPDVDENLADIGEAALRTLQDEHTRTFNSLVDLLQGGTGGYDELLNGDGKIDRSLQELMTLSRLHGVVHYLIDGGGDQAEAITQSTFERYVRQHPMTTDGQVRKWLTEGDAYHRDRLQRAIEGSNRGNHERFLQRDPSSGKDRWTNTYSQVTRELVRFSLDLLAGELEKFYNDAEDLRETAAVLYHLDLDPEVLQALINNPPTPVQDTTRGGPPTPSGYVSPDDRPTKSRIVETARRLDKEHNEWDTYDTALRRLRYDGQAAMACMKEGVDYRYYPASLSDPVNADHIRTDGEKYEPKSSETQTYEHEEVDETI